MRCPECYSTKLSRKYASFWAAVNEEGEDKAANFSDHQAATELTEETLCRSCGAEFEWDDAE